MRNRFYFHVQRGIQISSRGQDACRVGDGNSRITHTPNKRLRPILRPERRVVELSRVPHDLVHNLRNLDRVRGRAGTSGFEGPALGVGEVAVVVCGIEVFAVPASGDAEPRLREYRSYLEKRGRRGRLGTHVGKCTLTRIPPGHALGGKLFVSMFVPHGTPCSCRMSPPEWQR